MCTFISGEGAGSLCYKVFQLVQYINWNMCDDYTNRYRRGGGGRDAFESLR